MAAITAICIQFPVDTPHPLKRRHHHPPKPLISGFPLTHSSSSATHPLSFPIFSSSPSSYPHLPFLAPDDADTLHRLDHFSYSHPVAGGYLTVALMAADQIDSTVWLLAESFAESLLVPKRYVSFLAFLVRQYVLERRAVLPYAATLVGVYEGEGGGGGELAGTVEMSFCERGANSSPPTPLAPRDSAYICNMAVKKELRRRGIGWHLLKASEELITQISAPREVYLHCRMIDAAPLQMYTKAGYSVVKTDNILTWLTLQRRKHLMCKRLPAYKE